MRFPLQMRAPSKRWLAVASVLVIMLVTLAWSFARYRSRAGGFGEAASAETRPSGRVHVDAGDTISNARAELVDSDNDGVPDVAELRTFQDRDNFRQWFTDISEMQFY